MAQADLHIAEAQDAIEDAKEALAELAAPKPSRAATAFSSAQGKVPPAKRWWLPICLIAVLFAGQAAVATAVDDTTIGTVFALGAVIVAILTAIVAVLSYARQSAIPLSDIIQILDKLLQGLEALKKASEDAPDSGRGSDQQPRSSGPRGDAVSAEERPTEVSLAPRASP